MPLETSDNRVAPFASSTPSEHAAPIRREVLGALQYSRGTAAAAASEHAAPIRREVLGALLYSRGTAAAAAAALSALALPVVVLCTAAYNLGLSDLAADGVDVRAGNSEPLTEPLHPVFFVGFILSSIGPWLVVLGGAALLKASETSPDNVAFAGGGAILLAGPLFNVAGLTNGSMHDADRQRAFSALLVVVFVLGSLAIARRVPWRGARRLFLAQNLLFILFATVNSFTIFPWYFDYSGTTDAQRILYRTLGHPVLADACEMPMRALARLAPYDTRADSLLSLQLQLRAGANLAGRGLLLGFESPWATSLAVLLVCAVEVLARVTLPHREALAAAPWWGGFRPALAFMRGPRAQQVQSLVLFVDEITELWATVMMTALHIAMRIGPDRAAPDARDLALVGLVQVGAELATALGPTALALLTNWAPLRGLQRAALRRARAVRGLRRTFWAILALATVVGMLWTITGILAPGQAALYCGWSRHEGRWHRAACSSTSRWAG